MECTHNTPRNKRETTVASRQGMTTAGLHRTTEFDLQRLSRAVHLLETCGWYWGSMTGDEAKKLLRRKEVGTFLLRDSSDSAYLFCISVRTARGTTSVRIDYTPEGNFRLDSDGSSPEYDCIIKLVHHYMKDSNAEKPKHYWLEPTGRRAIAVKFSRPLFGKAPDLQHLCRTVINKHTPEDRVTQLPLPERLKKYLKDYPYGQ
ncbi:suppressor of cytokine signaling 2-like isoform X2 [Branchiostoma floridae x Branchiostoma belcheri]